jgi:hypothetical protein
MENTQAPHYEGVQTSALELSDKPDITGSDEEKPLDQDVAAKESKPQKKGSFWVVIMALALTGLLTALEATITSTALPTIIGALGGEYLYIWVVNVYFLTM